MWNILAVFRQRALKREFIVVAIELQVFSRVDTGCSILEHHMVALSARDEWSFCKRAIKRRVVGLNRERPANLVSGCRVDQLQRLALAIGVGLELVTRQHTSDIRN